MKQLQVLTSLCLMAGLALYPLMSRAQETPRTDPVASSPRAALPVPAKSAETRPATRPADTFTILRGNAEFWRIGKDAAGAWWFISPAGRAEFLNTVTTVQPAVHGRDRVGPDYLSQNFDEHANPDVALDHWARATLDRVFDTGFKGVGAWSHPVLHKYDVPMTRDLNVWSWLKTQSLRLFTPGWTTVAESTIESQVKPLRENKNLVGYYIDNELDWGDSASGPGFYFDGLPSADPNRIQVTKVIHSVWTSLGDFNRDWKTSVNDWSELDHWSQLPRHPAAAYQQLGSAWLSHMARAYFQTTTSLIRKYDPNHLILGVRFRGAAVPEVVSASRDYTDAQSLNYYVSDARLDEAMFRMIYELSGQPLIITEYSFHALDNRSGDRNTVGFPAQVMDQQARADGYRLFTTRLARVPWIIGADWFQWMDEPPSGRRVDGEDVNFGVVDIDDHPYKGLAQAIHDTTAKLNPLHQASPTDKQDDLWRESFTALPSARVPYLTTPIKINGELSDWPAAAQLNGMRATRTVGIERSTRPEPRVFLGWREEGLYLGLEVFDDDLSTAPANGWWWSRDSIEFFISTRPASGLSAFDENCHHFFFVPNDFPARDGVGGVVGQWHSPGDTLKDNLVPHPSARNSVRVFPDHYVVEIFVPAAALHGYDPAKQPQMAFNVHVRNHQHALEYFWSAPKQILTQCRPATWGSIYLDRPGTPLAQPLAPLAGAASDAAPVAGAN